MREIPVGQYSCTAVKEEEGEVQLPVLKLCSPTCVAIVHRYILKGAGLVIERLRVRIPAGAAGEFSSPDLTFYADSHSVSIATRVTALARKRPRSFCQKCKWQVTPKHEYILDPTKSEKADYALQA